MENKEFCFRHETKELTFIVGNIAMPLKIMLIKEFLTYLFIFQSNMAIILCKHNYYIITFHSNPGNIHGANLFQSLK